jgi:hypothetical protein
MKRPIGVTIIAALNILGLFALIVSEFVVSPLRPEGGLLGILVVVALFSVGLSVALLMLQNWARWVSIVLYAFSLLRCVGSVATANGAIDAVAGLVPGLYLLWAIWYLCQPHVKAAFSS